VWSITSMNRTEGHLCIVNFRFGIAIAGLGFSALGALITCVVHAVQGTKIDFGESEIEKKILIYLWCFIRLLQRHIGHIKV
jgi:hypothetical protein